MLTTNYTFCRLCASFCGLVVKTQDGKIVSIDGDRENPISDGYFCIKGRKAKELHNGEDRLYSSLIRSPDGVVKQESSERALDAVHERLSRIVEAHGFAAVGLYYGTGMNQNAVGATAMKDWFHSVGSPYIFTSMTVDQSAKWVTAGRMGTFATGKYNTLDADVLIWVGTNPAISHFTFGMPTMNPMKWLRKALDRGMKLITVDPRRSETAKLSTHHLAVKPGEDAALFAGLIKIVLDRGLQDRKFCERFVTSIDQLHAAVEPFTLEYVAERTAICPDQMLEVAELFATAPRKSVATGTGANMGAHSNAAEHLCEALNAICGGYRREGDTIYNVGLLFGGAARMEGVSPPRRTWESGVKCRTKAVGPIFGEYPSGLLADEILAEGPDRLRALIVAGGNPLKAIGGTDKMLRALKRLELLVVIDCRFNDTAELADVVIATDLMFEHDDCTGYHDGMFAHSYARIAPAILPRPPGVLSDLEVFWGLAKRMGKPLMLRRPSFSLPYSQIPKDGLVFGPDSIPSTAEAVRWMVSQGSVTYEELAKNRHGIWREKDLPKVEAALHDDGTRLDVCPPDVGEEIASLLADRPLLDYRYRLAVRRTLGTMNSALVNAARTRRSHPVNPAYMNPQDMADEALVDGATIEIRSANGAGRAQVQADAGLRRGVVSVTHGWGRVQLQDDPEGALGIFTGRLVAPDQLETINFMPRYTGIPINIQLVEGAVLPASR